MPVMLEVPLLPVAVVPVDVVALVVVMIRPHKPLGRASGLRQKP
jgi:hypothetical protein